MRTVSSNLRRRTYRPDCPQRCRSPWPDWSSSPNLLTLALLVDDLVNSQDNPGTSLLVAALQVWTTNVIAFGPIYRELERGGPVSQNQTERDHLPLADFRFTQDETQDTVVEVAHRWSEKADWIFTFVDYLYLSTTNSSAFGPTDTMP